ncbi:siderophore-interacting protein [Shewanella sp.]|uniref:siderophore-interacting protein n=1 Tax=Shewanella sp. TaxID=50422 RepID=UPI004053B1F1
MKSNMRMTQVHSIHDLSPHMRRIVLCGPELEDFPALCQSAHVKVIVPQPGSTQPKLGFYFGAKKWMRSYTVRQFDPLKKLLSIDIAVKDHQGTVSNWALNAKPGDYLGIGGPSAIKHTNLNADWHLIIGDFTALPAIAATLELLSSTAQGHVIIQVPTLADKLPLTIPASMTLRWVVNSKLHQTDLLDALSDSEWLPGKPAIFIAAEASQVKALHQYLKTQAHYQRKNTYASAYWKARKPA